MNGHGKNLIQRDMKNKKANQNMVCFFTYIQPKICFSIFALCILQYINPAKSAKNQPIGIEAQIAVTPMEGIEETV